VDGPDEIIREADAPDAHDDVLDLMRSPGSARGSYPDIRGTWQRSQAASGEGVRRQSIGDGALAAVAVMPAAPVGADAGARSRCGLHQHIAA